MVEILLTKNFVTIVDEIDADLAEVGWFAHNSTHGRTMYAERNIDKKTTGIHRIILSRMLGRELCKNEEVDHIDGNGLNNQRHNLRLATRRENRRNSRKPTNNTSGFKGVGWDKRREKWRAYIRLDYHEKHLGYFLTAKDAHDAYKAAAKELFGEFYNPGG